MDHDRTTEYRTTTTAEHGHGKEKERDGSSLTGYRHNDQDSEEDCYRTVTNRTHLNLSVTLGGGRSQCN